MPQGRTRDSDIQTLVEMGRGGVWSRDDALWALEETGGDVGRAGTLLINITSNGESVDAWRRNAPPAPGGATGSPTRRATSSSTRRGTTMAPLRVEDTRSLMMKIQPYAIATAQSGIKELLISTFAASGVPGGKLIGERLAQAFDIVIKGNDDSDLEIKLEKINKILRKINDRVKDIEEHILNSSPEALREAHERRTRGQIKKNKSKKKDKSKRKKRKTKRKPKK